MASDIQIIMEILGAEDMVKASKATQALENKLKLLSTQLAKGKLTWSQYMTGVNQLVSKNAKLAGGFRALQPEVMRFSSSLIKSNNQLQTATTQTDRLATATNNLSNAQKKSSAVAQINTRRMSGTGVAIQQAGYQVGDFLVQVQSGQNAMVAFGQQATQLVGVLPMVAGSLGLTMSAAVGLSAALGIVIPLVTAVGAYLMRTKESSDKATDSLGDFTSSLNSVNSASEVSSKSIRELREEYGRFAEQVKEASRVVAQAALADAMRSYEKSADTLAEGLGKVSGAMDAYSKQVAITKTIQDTLGERTVSNASAWDESEAAVENARKSLSAAAADMGVTTGEAELLQRTLDNMAKAKGLDEVATQAGLALLQFDKMFTSSKNIPPEIADIISALRKMQTESARASKNLDDTGDSANELTRGLSDAVNEAVRLRDVLNQVSRSSLSMSDRATVLRAQIAAAQSGQNVTGAGVRAETAIELGRGGATLDQIAKVAQGAADAAVEVEGLEDALSKLTNPPKTPSGGSGGGGGGSNRDSQLDSFISSLMTERETLEQWRSEQVDLLGQFNETELEIIGGHAEAKLRLEQEYSDKLVALKASESQIIKSQSSAMYSALGGFLDQFAGKSKAAAVASVALNKALSIAQAIQNTSVAYTKALIMDPTGAMAARVAMLGKIQVGLIAATGLSQAASAASGGASGTVSGSASGASATMPTQAVAATPQRVIIEGIDRDSLFSGEQLSKIFEAIYEENENRGTVFEVAR